jgi:DNA mismatch endonuclease (patch repair protein)
MEATYNPIQYYKIRLIERTGHRKIGRREQTMDRVSECVRRQIMSAVKTKDTLPELRLRSIIHRMGYRYALHRADLPGRPDLVFPSRRKIIFVHGCFWHGHRCRYGKLPKSKLEYWRPKVALNQKRDRRQQRILRGQGWSVMVVWQCQLKDAETLANRIGRFLANA